MLVLRTLNFLLLYGKSVSAEIIKTVPMFEKLVPMFENSVLRLVLTGIRLVYSWLRDFFLKGRIRNACLWALQIVFSCSLAFCRIAMRFFI